MQVDQTKIEVIAKLPPTISVKGVWSFLSHAFFYRRFIKDFSEVAHPLCKLLEKESTFNFYEACLKVFLCLKEKLVSVLIIIAPYWTNPFKLMCDASSFALVVVVGQCKGKLFHPIYYARKTLNMAQKNYTVVAHTDHTIIRYLMAKKDSKPRLIR
ncbi:hypothetical protein MTR67_052054 [Solanum verrucosum]|uniref:Reverse transcriptase/retrotransposon-derived protein RNase H-like domain-containing protein n=1 Tax=Solanum verrucosum TaxID=315347 RepID=A0AAF1A383_SOLVR|nr:hypothetical protein MTR67_052054 [Solanum verrucosum]